jgi:hypothetical protein
MSMPFYGCRSDVSGKAYQLSVADPQRRSAVIDFWGELELDASDNQTIAYQV